MSTPLGRAGRAVRRRGERSGREAREPTWWDLVKRRGSRVSPAYRRGGGWWCEHQQQIEDHLFRLRYGVQKPDLYLYDVTSSYLEGVCNALAAFGYCRDGKSGKMQVVYGLLCDLQGVPVSIQAFPGNTTDTKTFGSQVHKVSQRFGGGTVTFVGDRGMIKGPQIEQLQAEQEHEFHGCYCLKTDVLSEQASKETIHDRYKDLAHVEWAFRTSKTGLLEARPFYVRLETRTRGHLLVVMLAYLMVRELAKCWRDLELTVEEGLDELKSLCTTRVRVKGQSVLHNVFEPRESVQRLLNAAHVTLPKTIADRGVHVSTRKKLVEERQPHRKKRLAAATSAT
jgi:transposase